MIQLIFRRITGSKNNIKNILLHFFIHINILYHLPGRDDLFVETTGVTVPRRYSLHILADDHLLFLAGRVAYYPLS
jgi:hypothetical protein